jgi:hypothetical protein
MEWLQHTKQVPDEERALSRQSERQGVWVDSWMPYHWLGVSDGRSPVDEVNFADRLRSDLKPFGEPGC